MTTMTLTAVTDNFEGEHDVWVRDRWVGRVFVTFGWWAGQDFDGDVELFETMLGAAAWVRSMSGGMSWS